MESIIKSITVALAGYFAVLEPTLAYAAVLFFAIILDCISAVDLSRRLRKIHPDDVTGKFQSKYAMQMFKDFFIAYAVIILLHMVDEVILHNFTDLNLSSMGAAVFCAIQLWSVLENYSSANGARWAKLLQKIMVDKAERHFNVDLMKLKNDEVASAIKDVNKETNENPDE